MKLSIESIKSERSLWEQKGFVLPDYDPAAVREETEKAPQWIHFGAGNIFRGYIARLADELIGAGLMKSGVVAADSFDTETISKIYIPFDDLSLLVGLRAQGEKYLRIIGSIGKAVGASEEGHREFRRMAKLPSLQMISFTITEKGYAAADMNGRVLPSVESDISAGPEAHHSTALGVVSAMLYARFRENAAPIALVSMDNCSRNGDKLRSGVMFIVNGWKDRGLVEEDFVAYVSDSSKVSFPWSMIDKITPRPDPSISKALSDLGVEDMEPVITTRKTFIAPFVNAEMPEYLVIEDSFPNGRPPLEKAGVYMTDRPTVDKAEKMKVMTCLNPLHTALAVFGCLLGKVKIAEEMEDPDLKDLVYKLGYSEGLPVVIDPGIIRPEDFLKEVLTERLPNFCLPDTPQRIATDTSQKVAIRFGETIKAYEQKGQADRLELIPLVLAAWLRYLTGIDDSGNEMELSADPMLESLCGVISPAWFGGKEPVDREKVRGILSNKELFGTDLIKAGLSEKIISFFEDMLKGPGAVRSTLRNALEKVK
ncbi:MAG: mannitol dehydrogenase family protein [Ruminococcus sp.]|nr:mannitol dehydrogenase family protein [Ruminococcus sp.]